MYLRVMPLSGQDCSYFRETFDNTFLVNGVSNMTKCVLCAV